MHMRLLCVVALLVLAPIGHAANRFPECAATSKGWGDGVEWSPFLTGMATARQTKKPIMLILHKSWCGKTRADRIVFIFTI
jgi:hypothetical protein